MKRKRASRDYIPISETCRVFEELKVRHVPPEEGTAARPKVSIPEQFPWIIDDVGSGP